MTVPFFPKKILTVDIVYTLCYNEVMSKKDILEKAITKAVKNGWHWGSIHEAYENARIEHHPGDMNFVATHETIRSSRKDNGWEISYNDIIFNRDFAKALWNAPMMHAAEPGELSFETPDGLSEWQYHLQRMVISDDPIAYLGSHLDG